MKLSKEGNLIDDKDDKQFCWRDTSNWCIKSCAAFDILKINYDPSLSGGFIGRAEVVLRCCDRHIKGVEIL